MEALGEWQTLLWRRSSSDSRQKTAFILALIIRMTDPQSLLGNILTLFTWGGVSVLLFFLFGIARFFERKSSRSSYYPLFLFPIVLFLGSAIRYAITDETYIGDIVN